MEDYMKNVTVINHPLVQHKLTLMRDVGTSTRTFRELLKEIALLMGYEITRDLPLVFEEINTFLTVFGMSKVDFIKKAYEIMKKED